MALEAQYKPRPPADPDRASLAEGTRAPLPGSSDAVGHHWHGLAWRRQVWWIEVAVVVTGYLLYEAVQNAVDFERVTAYAHGRDVAALQRWLHIDIDPSINHFVNRFDWLAVGTSYYYNVLHYAVTVSLLVWLFLRRPDAYGRYRSALVLASMGSLIVFWLLPVAPPRLAVPGIIDSAVVHNVFGTVAAKSNSVVNDCAAMPSLHVGWAVWCAVAVIGTTTVRWRWLALLYPLATTFVVIGTGNHYLLDGVAGALVVTVALALTATGSSQRAGARDRSPDRPDSFDLVRADFD